MLIAGAADLGVALSGLLSPSRFDGRVLWALGVLVCIALLGWIWRLAPVMWGRPTTRASRVTARRAGTPDAAVWSRAPDPHKPIFTSAPREVDAESWKGGHPGERTDADAAQREPAATGAEVESGVDRQGEQGPDGELQRSHISGGDRDGRA